MELVEQSAKEKDRLAQEREEELKRIGMGLYREGRSGLYRVQGVLGDEEHFLFKCTSIQKDDFMLPEHFSRYLEAFGCFCFLVDWLTDGC